MVKEPTSRLIRTFRAKRPSFNKGFRVPIWKCRELAPAAEVSPHHFFFKKRGELGTRTLPSGDERTPINHGDRFVGQPPLLNELAIGTIRLCLIKSVLHSVEHGRVTLTNDNALQTSIHNRAANGKF